MHRTDRTRMPPGPHGRVHGDHEPITHIAAGIDGDAVNDGVGDTVLVRVGVGDGGADLSSDVVGVAVTDVLPVTLTVAVADTDGTSLADGVVDGDSLTVAVADADMDSLTEELGVSDAESLTLAVADGDTDAVSETDDVTDGVTDGDGVTLGLMHEWPSSCVRPLPLSKCTSAGLLSYRVVKVPSTMASPE